MKLHAGSASSVAMAAVAKVERDIGADPSLDSISGGKLTLGSSQFKSLEMMGPVPTNDASLSDGGTPTFPKKRWGGVLFSPPPNLPNYPRIS
jgi:hypothetical protein